MVVRGARTSAKVAGRIALRDWWRRPGAPVGQRWASREARSPTWVRLEAPRAG